MAKAKNNNKSIRIKSLCGHLGFATSSYYKTSDKLQKRDREDIQVIQKYFTISKHKDGIRQLKMVIERSEGIVMNHKKIARLKKKFKLLTFIRRRNKHRHFAKKKIEHETCANLVDRNFKDLKPNQIYSTDITNLKYQGKKAYLAAVKDLATKEIVGHAVSNRIDISLTNTAIKDAFKKLGAQQLKQLIVHSDQGFHFTHFSFRNLLDANGVTQSMSRKGNCLDNAPIESFFGLIKDHLELGPCKNVDDVRKEVTRIIRYYNNDRPQVGLKKMPPKEYRRHFD